MSVLVIERLELASGITIEVRRHPDAPRYFAPTAFGIEITTDSETGKRAADLELIPWHRVRRVTLRRCRA